MPRNPSYPYSAAQREFIERTRSDIDADPNYFHSRDWRCIAPSSGKYCSLGRPVYADSFYVKPMAAWVPHLLIHNFVPTCPHCKRKDFVSLHKVRWQNSPKTLFGLKGHRYLDTMLYPCSLCKRQFTGYNPESLKHDMETLVGFFNFHLAGRFAVDEELYSFLVSSWDIETTKIHRTLQQMAVDMYVNDEMLYYHAVRMRLVKSSRPNVSANDRRQRTLHSVATESQLTQWERTTASIRDELRSAKMLATSARAKTLEKVCFKTLRQLKKGRNGRSMLLPGIGYTKLDDLMKAGIMNARELVDYAGVPAPWCRSRESGKLFEKYRQIANQLFRERTRIAASAEEKVEKLEEQLAAAQSELDLERERISNDRAMQIEPEIEETRVPQFSKMMDVKGYNARVLSTGRIETILMTDFLHQKKTQQSKMMNLSAQVLKLDFNYKITNKVHVYDGPGKGYRPYGCMATVQNEDNQTVFYKVCEGSESIDEITPGLEAFNTRNRDKVKVVYVDNCCTTRAKLQGIFEEALVKLDPFHWFQRWDQVLYDAKSEESAVFRGLMRRAVFNCDNTEYTRAKEEARNKLRKSGKDAEPTPKQIMAEARTVIPPKEELLRNVIAVLRYCYHNDSAIRMKRMVRSQSDTSSLPNPFFKPEEQKVARGRTVFDVILSQLSHIKEDCLSDPPGVNLHRQNPKTKKIYCCRGTSSCETFNLYVDRLTGNSLGVGKADRLLSTYVEVSNDRKKVSRNGMGNIADILFTHRTERFVMANELAKTAGVKEDDLPYDLVCYPCIPTSSILAADVGFDRALDLPDGTRIGDILEDEATRVEQGAAFVENEGSDTEEEDDNESISGDEDSVDDNNEEDIDGEGVETTVESLLPVIRQRVNERGLQP